MTMICDETILKLMRSHHKQAKRRTCLNLFEFDFDYLCFRLVGNLDTDIVGLRQHNNIIF